MKTKIFIAKIDMTVKHRINADLLSEYRINKLKTAKNNAVYCEQLCAELLLLYALKNSFGIKKVPEIAVGKLGKPYFCGEYKDIYFSLSHAGGFAAAILCETEVGLDILPKSKKIDLAKLFVGEKETFAKNAATDAEAFCRLESYVKLVGGSVFSKIDVEDEKKAFYYAAETDALYLSTASRKKLDCGIVKVDFNALMSAYLSE